MIKPPPPHDPTSPTIFEIIEKHPGHIQEYLHYHNPLDSKGRYLHFHKLRYKVSAHLDPVLAWRVTKAARLAQLSPIIKLGVDIPTCRFMLTPSIQKAISETDRNTTTAALEWMTSKIGENNHLEYLLNDLIEDEAINSSQLEGAATTTKVAKNLLKRKRKARNSDEKMIIGNYKMMTFAWEHRHETLSTDLIKKLHYEGVEGINDDKYHPGHFRRDNDIIVENNQGELIHQPPTADGLETRLKLLAAWVNTNHHDADSQDYIHPLVKAISIHFAIGYEHPFRDGNGRVARSLFYWYLFKNEYAAFRYISISVLLKKSPAKYVRSYLYTETDEMDLTYFIDFHSRIVSRAISAYKSTYEKALTEQQEFNNWLWKSGLLKKLTDKQLTIFHVASSGTVEQFTATNTAENLGCSFNTASKALNGLVKIGLFIKTKDGREWIFSMRDKEAIKSGWKP